MAIDKEKKKSVDAILGKINKKFGNNTISYLKDVEDELKLRFLKSPSYEFNAMLYGGVAETKVIEFAGLPGSGKTSMAMELIKEKQKENQDFVVAWLETENSVDKETLEMFGIDTDRVVFISQTEELPAEQCMDIIRSLVSSGEFGLVVVNSAAALLPSKEVEDDIDKQNIGLLARMLSKFLRITVGSLARTKTTLLIINQMRQSIGSYVPMMTTCGGMAIPFYAHQRVEFKRKKIESGDPIKDDEGMKIVCNVKKNRAALKNPFKTCTYFVRYGKGIDGNLELGIVLPREGVVTKSGSWIYFGEDKDHVKNVPTVNGEVPGKWNGAVKFVDALNNDNILREFMINQLENNGMEGTSLSSEEIKAAQEEETAIEEAGKELEKNNTKE